MVAIFQKKFFASRFLSALYDVIKCISFKMHSALRMRGEENIFKKSLFYPHNLIKGVLIQSCSTEAKNFTNYVFCHLQFSGVIQNIENRLPFGPPFVYVNNYQNNQFYRVKRFSIFWITLRNCG